MRAVALLSESGARWRYVSIETEDRSVTGRAMSEEAKRIGLTTAGLVSERSGDDGTNTLFWTDVDDVEVYDWVSSVAERTEETYGQASYQKQEA